nr:MAG TPA: hypothetical protein [Caudoviricetes sp.]DAX82992.1 MAG TPA: hypothetical protein [Caudoviricetes sp.]
MEFLLGNKLHWKGNLMHWVPFFYVSNVSLL